MRQLVIVAVISAAIGVGLTRFYWPKIDTKITVQEKEVVKKDIVTVVRTIVKKDGTSESVSTTTDRSVEQSDKQQITIVSAKPSWDVSLGALTGLKTLEPAYQVQVQRRILGPFKVGIIAGVSQHMNMSDQKLGLSIGMEF